MTALLEHLVKKDLPFTLVTDVSTTSMNVPYLICFIMTTEDGYPITYYYSIVELKQGESAAACMEAFWEQVKADDILAPGFLAYFKKRLLFLSTDSANVMVGLHNSFYTKLQNVTENSIKSIGCHAHKIALVIKAAVRDTTDPDMDSVRKFEKNLNDLYGFYMSRGSKRFQHLAQTAQVHGMHLVRLRKNIQVRWSTAEYGVVSAVLTDWGAIEVDLKDISQASQEFTHAAMNQAFILHDEIIDVGYVMLCHEFIDFLGINSVISRQFQQRSSILPDHARSVLHAVASYEYLQASPGQKLSEFISLCECQDICEIGSCSLLQVEECIEGKLLYKGVILKKADENFSLSRIRENLYNKLIGALHDYFSIETLDSLTVFDNRMWGGTQDEASFLTKSIHACHQMPVPTEDCEPVSKELFKLATDILPGSEFAASIGKYNSPPPSKFWPAVLQNTDLELTPKTRSFLNIMMIYSDSSSECERGFSFMNRIAKDTRSSLKQTSLDALLRIRLNGNKPVSEINAFKYAKEFIHRDNHVPVDAFHGTPKRKVTTDVHQMRVSRLF